MISKQDYAIALLVGFFTGIATIPTAYNLGVHTALTLLLLPWVGAVVITIGVWLAGFLSRWASFFAQFGKFVATGLLNTSLDFGVLNLLSRASGVTAGYIVGGINIPGFLVAVINSFFLNKYWVFHDRDAGKSMFSNFPQFFAVTIIGLALNSGIIAGVTAFIHPFGNLNPSQWLNVAKVAATAIVLIWNFLGYKFVVFRANV